MTRIALFLGLIVFAGISQADPPTPVPQPEKWELLGSYHVGIGSGRGLVYAAIDPESIKQDTDVIYRAYVVEDAAKGNGRWTPAPYSIVASFKIDCKYHTYNELWFQTDRGFQQMPDEWDKIEPDSAVGLAEKRLCRTSAKGATK